VPWQSPCPPPHFTSILKLSITEVALALVPATGKLRHGAVSGYVSELQQPPSLVYQAAKPPGSHNPQPTPNSAVPGLPPEPRILGPPQYPPACALGAPQLVPASIKVYKAWNPVA
jgi:hypothetical protein